MWNTGLLDGVIQYIAMNLPGYFCSRHIRLTGASSSLQQWNKKTQALWRQDFPRRVPPLCTDLETS